jgi:DNA-binding NtrC family response regulator
LNVIRIDVPPLRERREDIPTLVDHFIQKFSTPGRRIAGLTDRALATLTSYHWPGNVRELENTIERAALLGSGERITELDLPPQLFARAAMESSLQEALARRHTLRDLEREYIKRVLESTGGNKTETAHILGVDRTTLYRKIEEMKEGE